MKSIMVALLALIMSGLSMNAVAGGHGPDMSGDTSMSNLDEDAGSGNGDGQDDQRVEGEGDTDSM